MRMIKAKYSGKCDECGEHIEEGEYCLYNPEEKFLLHPDCSKRRRFNTQSPVKPVQGDITARYKPKQKYITVTSGISGYFAVMYDEDGPIQTGIGRYSNFDDAAQEAREWAKSEGLHCSIQFPPEPEHNNEEELKF